MRNGTFADPFGVATGPTAHVGMLTPLPSAAAYWLFGVNTPAAEFALSAWAIAIVFLGLFLCWRLAGELGVPRIARLGAVAFAAIVPLQFKLELQEGRNWEVNLAVMMLLWILLRLVIADKRGSRRAGWLLVTGAAGGTSVHSSVRRRVWRRSWPSAFFSIANGVRGNGGSHRLAFIAVAGLLGGVWAGTKHGDAGRAHRAARQSRTGAGDFKS